MKLRRARIENFRGLEKLEIDFLEDSAAGEAVPRSFTCLVGDNGARKTSALQAIGLVLWMAGGRDRRVDGFAWEGFLPERMGTLGKTRVEVEVAFTDQEIELARKVLATLLAVDNSLWPLPQGTGEPIAAFVFEAGAVFPPTTLGSSRMPFLGRWALDQIAKTHPELFARRSELGSVVWFQQNRLPRPDVRAELVGWWAKHTSPAGQGRNGSDPVSRFNENLDRVFPGLRFVGVDEDPTSTSTAGPKSFYCLFERGGKPYDLAELSSGEQAVFPFAYEFALRAPGPSVVLIDELELHLHPPPAAGAPRRPAEARARGAVRDHDALRRGRRHGAGAADRSPRRGAAVPVTVVYVEGKLKVTLFGKVFAGVCQVSPHHGTKGSLAPRVRDARRQGIQAVYVRDRDFDFEPPGVLHRGQPTVDKRDDKGGVLGWRWCRHSVESYLLDPGVVEVATGWARGDYEERLVAAARRVRHYEAARWVVGQLRPRERIELTTAPDDCVGREFRIPDDVGEAACSAWLTEHVRKYQERIEEAMSSQRVGELRTRFAPLFEEAALDVFAALDLCSGKDLLTALGPSIRWGGTRRAWDPTQLRELLATWVADHPDEALACLPEWSAFRDVLRS